MRSLTATWMLFILLGTAGLYAQEGGTEPATSTSSEVEPDRAAIDAFMKSAQIHISTKKFSKAIDEINNAIALDPEYANAYIERGGAKFLMQDLEAALADYNKAVELIDLQVKSHTRKARIQRVLEDQVNATKEAKQAADKNALLGECYYRRGNVKIFLEDLEGGCKDINESMNLGYPTALRTCKEFCGCTDKKEESGAPEPKKPDTSAPSDTIPTPTE